LISAGARLAASIKPAGCACGGEVTAVKDDACAALCNHRVASRGGLR